MGNSRWVEFTDVDGEKRWRRLSGVETARAFGMKETGLDRFQHLNDQEIHAAGQRSVYRNGGSDVCERLVRIVSE